MYKIWTYLLNKNRIINGISINNNLLILDNKQMSMQIAHICIKKIASALHKTLLSSLSIFYVVIVTINRNSVILDSNRMSVAFLLGN